MTRSSTADSVYPRLGAVLGVRHTKADIALGQDIAARRAQDELDGLVELLAERDVASSAIKAIYECGYLAPELLVPHLDVFVELVAGRNNRMIWGGMIAVSCAAKAAPEKVWEHRETLEAAWEAGTVITKVSAIHAFAAVAADSPDRAAALSPLFERVLREADPKQLVQMAEAIVPVAVEDRRGSLLAIATSRREELATDNARKRLDRLVRRQTT